MDLIKIAARIANAGNPSVLIGMDKIADVQAGFDKLKEAYEAHLASGEPYETFEQDQYYALDGDIVFGVADNGDVLAMGLGPGNQIDDDPFYREPITNFNAADCLKSYQDWVKEVAANEERY